jgi:hypothetical protein
MSTVTTEDKKENLKKLREFHKKALEEKGVQETSLIGKMAYRPSGKVDKYVSFFHSEITKGNDVYLEFTDRFNVPEDSDRTLYLYRFNPHFDEEYEKVGGEDVTSLRYLVPVAELETVKKYSPEAVIAPKGEKIKVSEVKTEFDFGLPDVDQDPPLNEITIRDLAAILLQRPVSKKEWLNTLIKQK